MESLLGSGGMGSVYLAHQLDVDRKVAVKVLHPYRSVNENLRLRFQREAKIIAKLNHPNIVQILLFGTDNDGSSFIVMEHVDGRSLKDELADIGRYSETEALKLVDAICAALQEAHAHSVVHRDLKPSNILLAKQSTEGRVVKVVDFGVAKLGDRSQDLSTLTGEGVQIGTPVYMSPEQVRTQVVDERSDLYSVGLILYTLGGGCPDWTQQFDCPGDFRFATVRFVGLDCLGYRLPTEAKWEYAARAGNTNATYAGPLVVVGDSNAPVLDSIARYGGNSGVTYAGADDCSSWTGRQYYADFCGTGPVMERTPNDWGLYDMLGNVHEWVWDPFGTYPHGTTLDPLGTGSENFRINRGGAWGTYATSVRLGIRFDHSPLERNNGIGFRLVRTSLPALP